MTHKNIEKEIIAVAEILAAWPYLDGQLRNSIAAYSEIRFPVLHPVIKALADPNLKIAKGNEHNIMSGIIDKFAGEPSTKNALDIYYNTAHERVESDMLTKTAPYNIVYVQGVLTKLLREYLNDMYQIQKDDVVFGLLKKYSDLKDVTNEMLVLTKVYFLETDNEPKTFMERIKAASDPNNQVTEYKLGTGFSSLNNRINEGGLIQKRATIVEARSGFGKTSFILQLANHVALEEERDVLILSFEMSQSQLMDRMLSQATRQPVTLLLNTMKSGHIPDEIIETAEKLDQRVSIQYPGNTGEISYIEAEILDYIRIHGKSPELVIVDYIQQLTMGNLGRFVSRPDDLEAVSRALRGFSQQYNTHMMIASQITEGSDGQVKSYGARAIEHAADLVLFLDKNPTDENKRLLKIKKNRFGPSDVNIELIWNANITSFFEEDDWNAAAQGIFKGYLETAAEKETESLPPLGNEPPEIGDEYFGDDADSIPF